MISPPALKKYSKFERVCDWNRTLIIEKRKGPFVEWMTATGMAN